MLRLGHLYTLFRCRHLVACWGYCLFWWLKRIAHGRCYWPSMGGMLSKLPSLGSRKKNPRFFWVPQALMVTPVEGQFRIQYTPSRKGVFDTPHTIQWSVRLYITIFNLWTKLMVNYHFFTSYGQKLGIKPALKTIIAGSDLSFLEPTFVIRLIYVGTLW